MLELQHICYSVTTPEGVQDILKDVSIVIPDNKLVVFTGPNGGGKTTLAKSIMGLVQPTGGTILWNGQDITNLGITERSRLGIGYGFQQPPRFKGIRVRDLLNIAAGTMIRKSMSRLNAFPRLLRFRIVTPSELASKSQIMPGGNDLKRLDILD